MPVEVMSLKGSVDIDLAPFQRKAKQLKTEWEQLGKAMALKDPTTGGAAGQARHTEARFANELAAASAKLTSALAGESSAAQQVAARYSTLSAARRQELVAVLEQQQALKASAQAQQQLGNNLKQVGGTLTAAVTLPLVAFGVHAVKVFGTAEQSLNVFQQVTGATADEMARAGDEAKALGADMNLPATSSADAAKAMVELGKAGLSATESMEAARPALQLAAAAGIDAGAAANIAAEAMNAFHLSAAELPRVMDQLAGAANASTGEISDFALGFQQASAVFAQAGLNTSELTASLAEMANSGVRASDAGTSLRVMLTRLNPETKQAKAAMKALGVDAFDSAGRMKPLRDQVEQFSRGLSRFNQKGQQRILLDIFGQDAMRAAQIVLGGGAKAFDQMTVAVDKQGSAAATAAAKNKGLLGALDAMKSAFDTAASGAIETVSKDLANMARRAGELMGAFANLPEPVRRTVTVLGALVAATGPVLYGTGALITSFRTVRSAIPAVVDTLKGLWAAFAAAPGWTKIAVLAIGGLALAWSKDFMGIRTTTMAFIEWVTPLFSNAWEIIRHDATEFLQNFVADWQGAIGGLVDSITGQLSGFGKAILAGISAPFEALGAAWDNVPEGIKRLLLGAIPGLNQIRDLGNYFKDAIGFLSQYADAAQQLKATFGGEAATPGKPKGTTPAQPLPGAGGAGYEGAADKTKKSPLQTELEQLQARVNELNTTAAAMTSGLHPKIAAMLGQFRQAGATEKGQGLIGQIVGKEALADAKKQLADLQVQIKELSQEDPSGLIKLQKAFGGLVPDDLLRQLAEANTAIKDLSRTAQGWAQFRELKFEGQIFDANKKGLFLYTPEQQNAMQLFHKDWGKLTEEEKKAGAAALDWQRIINRNKEGAQRIEQYEQDLASASLRAGMALTDMQDSWEAFASGSQVAQRALDMLHVRLSDLPPDARSAVTKTIKEMMRLETAQRFIGGFTEGIQGLFQDMFSGLMDHGFKNFAADLVDGFKRLWQKIAIDYLTSQLTNLILKNALPFLANVFGGGAAPTPHARGGPFGAGELMKVGEQGPELVRFNRPGTVVPNSQLAGAMGGNSTVNIHLHGITDYASFKRNEGQMIGTMNRESERMRRRNGNG